MARGMRLAIELSPEWIAVSIMRGDRQEGIVVEPVGVDAWEAAWSDRLRPLDEPLKRCIAQLSAHGAKASVYHYAPDAICELFSCPAKGAAAQQAAKLALADHATYDLGSNPCGVWMLGADRTGETRQTHILTAADKDSSARIIADWLERADLKCEVVVPAEGANLAWLVRRLLALPDEGGRVLMWLGSHRSALAVGGGGRLSLVRRLDIGVETLAAALTKPSLAMRDEGKGVTMSRDDARRLLHTAGIPRHDSVIDAEKGLRGVHILPLLQPILQKCVVELKQSLRFGLAEAERQNARLIIIGPGADIPRLGAVLSEQTELTLDTIAAEDIESNDLAVALRASPAGYNLLHLEAAKSLAIGRARRALWTGAAVAVAVAIGSAAMTAMEASASKARLDSLKPSISGLESLVKARAAGDAENAGIERVLAGSDKAMGAAPRWSAFLQELASLTPEHVRIFDIVCDRANQSDAQKPGSRVDLSGVTTPAPGTSAPDINAFVQLLSRSPLIESVTLGATERSVTQGIHGLRFSLSIRLVESLTNPARADASGVMQP